jgi:hypothetical protein
MSNTLTHDFIVTDVNCVTMYYEFAENISDVL